MGSRFEVSCSAGWNGTAADVAFVQQSLRLVWKCGSSSSSWYGTSTRLFCRLCRASGRSQRATWRANTKRRVSKLGFRSPSALTGLSFPQKNASASTATRRSPTQCRVMSQDIVTLYVSLLSAFFTLSSSHHSPPHLTGAAAADPNATPPLPPFVPPNSNAAANCHWLLKTLSELTECVSELGALELAGEASQSLKELVASTRWRFEEAICSSWVRGGWYLIVWLTAVADCFAQQTPRSSTDSKPGSRIPTSLPPPPIFATSPLFNGSAPSAPTG